ncbi:amino acid adenylation domain-containing protein [Kitasatospora sp. NPDC005856]|uniref:amino acid adenylation domain-containing protein n=1 Tax=Kitasatospora sp. NPDC005856 TaxID=3154566 RepID=UPI0033CA5EF5
MTTTPTGVPGLIRTRVLADPAATALRTPDTTVSYAELWQRAEDGADELRAHGVRPGDVVAVRLPSGPGAIVAMLGAWLAGAAFLPVDTATPQERREYLLRHSRAVALIDGTGVTGLRPERAEPLAQAHPAYVIYTSGSTGTPKGVLVEHPALAGHVDAVVGLLGLTEADTVLQFASIGFDVAQEEIWPTLAAGGTLAFHGGGVPDSAALADLLRTLAVTVLQLPTAYWRMLCADLDGVDRPGFAGVRTTVIGGESATAADARAHRRTPLGHTVLVNGYGPTETVITATALLLPPDAELGEAGGLPIGRPVGDRRLHVLDDRRQPVTPGEPGELWIGGPLLAAGYLHDPRRTAERFLPDPFEGPAARMYRTGDLVRRDPDGNLDFLGRIDNQVKIRGHRVELDEVDRHLLDLPGITSAVSFTLDDGTGGHLLAAAITPAADGPGPEAVRELLRARVPGYLVPGRIAALDRLPLTTSGKIDRQAAAAAATALFATALFATALFATPQEPAGPGGTPLEETVRLLRTLLQAPALGPDDDFLAHGGDSLTAMRVCARMRSRGLAMQPADLLTGRTARSAVDRAGQRGAPLTPVEEEPPGPLDLLPAQRRWLQDGRWAEPDHFCLNALFAVDPSPDADASPDADRLTAVAAELLRRHPALRTALDPDGTAVLTAPDPARAVERVDLREVPADERGARLESALASAQTSMSLADGRVFRLLHVDVGDGTARLLLTVHHFVLDGVSMGLLVDDLEALLAGTSPEPATAGPRAIGTALRSWLDSPEARQDAAAWTAGTGGFAALTPDSDGPGLLPSLRVHRFRLGPEATRLVTHALPEEGVAPHDFTLGCLVGGLARWTGEPVHGVDVYAHSRDVPVGNLDLSRTVGYVQSTFPAVLRWSGRGPAALRTALAALDELPQRRHGFDALRFGSPVPQERDALDARPRPSVRLNFRGHLLRLEQRAPGAVLRPADEDHGAQRSPRQCERYLLMVEGDIVDGELEVSVKYSTGHWSPDRIEGLATEIERAMTEVLAECGARPEPAGGAR